jgi:crossover junction endodeoxyribonuclease RuvC
MKRILALDPSQSTGWAYTRGKWGVEKFIRRPWRHPFAHYLDFRAWLLERIDTLEVEALAFEGVLSAGGRGNGQRHEWNGIILAVAAECDLPFYTMMPSSLKKYATGNGRAERPEMRAALKDKFGLDLAEDEHDAIAAIWVLSYATAEYQADPSVLTTSWTGFPANAARTTKQSLCNRCQHRFRGGLTCPRCKGGRIRLEAFDRE